MMAQMPRMTTMAAPLMMTFIDHHLEKVDKLEQSLVQHYQIMTQVLTTFTKTQNNSHAINPFYHMPCPPPAP